MKTKLLYFGLVLFVCLITLFSCSNDDFLDNCDKPIEKGIQNEQQSVDFAIELSVVGSNRIDVIRKVRELLDCKLQLAIYYVNSAPVIIAFGDKDFALRCQEELQSVGATVLIK